VNPGSGLSKYSDQDQSVNTIAEDVVALMSQLSLSPAKTILVGHSMGGIVACQLASQSRYAGIALLGPVHPVPGLADIFSSRIKRVQESMCLAVHAPE
jgi:pimeloyl-ACP methyl ester carboxylesterase